MTLTDKHLQQINTRDASPFIPLPFSHALYLPHPSFLQPSLNIYKQSQYCLSHLGTYWFCSCRKNNNSDMNWKPIWQWNSVYYSMCTTLFVLLGSGDFGFPFFSFYHTRSYSPPVASLVAARVVLPSVLLVPIWPFSTKYPRTNSQFCI